MNYVRPFLKWPGGKFRLLPTLYQHLPTRCQLVEPFVGAGALFLNSPHPQVMVNDINPDLINLYQQLQQSGLQFIQAARKFFTKRHNHAQYYYRHRDRFNETQDCWEKALLFLYLNRHGYNGLCRYNLQGYYNVPFGAYHAPYFPESELQFFCQRAQTVKFFCEDYVALINRFLKQRSLQEVVFYCDPPYATLSQTANFTGYAAHRFNLEHQHQLAQLAIALTRKGATVLISNHDTPYIRELYQAATLFSLKVNRPINCQGHNRTKAAELIARFDP